MGLSLGDGIALASLCLVVLGVIIKYERPKSNGSNGNGSSVCKEHSGVVVRVSALESWLQDIDKKMDIHHEQVITEINNLKIRLETNHGRTAIHGSD